MDVFANTIVPELWVIIYLLHLDCKFKDVKKERFFEESLFCCMFERLRTACRSSELDFSVLDRDVVDKPEGDHIRNDRAAAVAQERQGDTGDRHDAHGHGDVFEDLEGEHADDADDDQRAEHVLAGACHTCDRVDQPRINDDDARAADEAKLFADDREDKVGVADRQELQALLGAVEQPLAEQAAGADRDLGLVDLVVAL